MSTGPGLRPGSSPSGTTRQASPRAARPRPSNQTRTARLPPAKPTGKEVNEEDDATKSADIQTPLKSSLESSPSISGNAATEAALDAASAVVASQDLTQVLERLDKLEKENEVGFHKAPEIYTSLLMLDRFIFNSAIQTIARPTYLLIIYISPLSCHCSRPSGRKWPLMTLHPCGFRIYASV
jgi:hypothetical protein